MRHLQNVRIKNFKAIRDSGRITLGPLTVFIGNNGAGKSSLIEALQLYRAVVTEGVDAAFAPFNGIQHARHKGARLLTNQAVADPESQQGAIGIRFAGKVPQWGKTEVDMALNVRGSGLQYIQAESCIQPDGSAMIRDFAGAAATYGEGRSIVQPVGDLRRLYDAVERWQFVALQPDIMGPAQPQKRVRGRVALARDGSNLGGFVLDLAERDANAFNGVVETMQFVLSYAKDIRPVMPHGDIDRRVFLEMAEQNFRVPSWLFSSGTLRLLAILCLLRDPDPPPVIFIEELENGLDPRSIHLIVEEVRNAVLSGVTQVIATTHSPYLLDLLTLDHLVLVERDAKGQPRFTRPASNTGLQQWASDFAPGKLYTMGGLSGGKA